MAGSADNDLTFTDTSYFKSLANENLQISVLRAAEVQIVSLEKKAFRDPNKVLVMPNGLPRPGNFQIRRLSWPYEWSIQHSL